jgi:hypothetical protein
MKTYSAVATNHPPQQFLKARCQQRVRRCCHPLLLIPVVFTVALLCFTQKAQAQQGAFWATGPVSASPGGSGGAPAAGGDLQITVGCAFWAWAPTTFEVSIGIQVDGEQMEVRHYAGFEYLSGDVQVTVNASTHDRQMYCYVWSTYGSYQSSATLKGSGPTTGRVEIKSFIPSQYLINPFLPWTLFQGDDRGFGSCCTSRMTTVYEVFNPALNSTDVWGEQHFTGETVLYDGFTSLDSFFNLTDEAKNDWEPGPPLKMAWENAVPITMGCTPPQRLGPNPSVPSSTHQFNCYGAASDPLVPIAPPVTWNITIKLEYGNNQVKYQTTGCISWFPAFEVYVNGSAIFQSTSTESPTDLFYGCGKDAFGSGVF